MARLRAACDAGARLILLTGGSGLLGRHLRQHLDCIAPSRSEFDVERSSELPAGVSMIVHAAAYTDVERAEQDHVQRYTCFGVNVLGTLNMAFLGVPLVYISTEYVFDGERGDYGEADVPNPVNAYARSKAIGELMAKHAPRHLIIRTLFKPRPFEHPRAVTDQWTSGDYVDVIAPQIAKAVKLFEAGALSGIVHVGTGKKSTFELAKQSRQVEPIERKDVCVPLPRDTSLNLAKWRSLSAAT